MKDWNKNVQQIEDLPQIASELLQHFSQERVFAFYGDLGAGKTTFIKVVCEQLGVVEEVTSPTFSIINEYYAKNESVYHFDFYRIDTWLDAVNIGAEEYFYSGRYCFIEWPERIEKILPAETIKIRITTISETERDFRIIN